jgi:hypothetical protein
MTTMTTNQLPTLQEIEDDLLAGIRTRNLETDDFNKYLTALESNLKALNTTLFKLQIESLQFRLAELIESFTLEERQFNLIKVLKTFPNEELQLRLNKLIESFSSDAYETETLQISTTELIESLMFDNATVNFYNNLLE